MSPDLLQSPRSSSDESDRYTRRPPPKTKRPPKRKNTNTKSSAKRPVVGLGLTSPAATQTPPPNGGPSSQLDQDFSEEFYKAALKDIPTIPGRTYGAESHFKADYRSPRQVYPDDNADVPTFSPDPADDDDDEEEEEEEEDKTLLGRLKTAFANFTADPPLPSPPPSHQGSRRNSFTARERTDSDLGGDMMLRAMGMNDDRVVDIDDPQLEPKEEKELPFFLRNRNPQVDKPKPVSPSDEEEKKDESGLSYRQRRKASRHQILYHRDTMDSEHGFICVLARALLTFGSPSHRIEPQLDSVAAVFGLSAQFSHTPGCVQISLGSANAKGSETILIKASAGLDLGRIHATHEIYRGVVRDEIYAADGERALWDLLKMPPVYTVKFVYFLTWVMGSLLCGISFGGSIFDMALAGPFAVFVMFFQRMASRTELSSSGSDIVSAGIVSFASRAIASRAPNHSFCYQAISSSAVAGLLPGSLILSGVLDIASRNLTLGAPKITAGLLTSLYLGFGLTLGSDIWLRIDSAARLQLSQGAGMVNFLHGRITPSNHTTPLPSFIGNLTGTYTFTSISSSAATITAHEIKGCYRDRSSPWYLQPLPWYTLIFMLPIYNFCSSMKRGQKWKTVPMVVMVMISCVSSGLTRYVNIKLGLGGHPDYVSLIGSFVVSALGNLYSRKIGGTAFTIMLTGILLLIPTGLAEAGGLSNSYTGPGEDEYTNSLELARKMISVIIGVMSGVYLSARIIYSFGKKKNSALVTF